MVQVSHSRSVHVPGVKFDIHLLSSRENGQGIVQNTLSPPSPTRLDPSEANHSVKWIPPTKLVSFGIQFPLTRFPSPNSSFTLILQGHAGSEHRMPS